MAGFDDAIADGVDFISISIGGGTRDYFNDPIAIGAFHAMRKGILTSCSAGNDGPELETVQNVAPWIFTVAASGIDRQFKTVLKLGNGKRVPVCLLSLSLYIYNVYTKLILKGVNKAVIGFNQVSLELLVSKLLKLRWFCFFFFFYRVDFNYFIYYYLFIFYIFGSQSEK